MRSCLTAASPCNTKLLILSVTFKSNWVEMTIVDNLIKIKKKQKEKNKIDWKPIKSIEQGEFKYVDALTCDCV